MRGAPAEHASRVDAQVFRLSRRVFGEVDARAFQSLQLRRPRVPLGPPSRHDAVRSGGARPAGTSLSGPASEPGHL